MYIADLDSIPFALRRYKFDRVYAYGSANVCACVCVHARCVARMCGSIPQIMWRYALALLLVHAKHVGTACVRT